MALIPTLPLPAAVDKLCEALQGVHDALAQDVAQLANQAVQQAMGPAVQQAMTAALAPLQHQMDQLQQTATAALAPLPQQLQAMNNSLARLYAAQLNAIICAGAAGENEPLSWPAFNGQALPAQLGGHNIPATAAEVRNVAAVEAIDAVLGFYGLPNGPNYGAAAARRRLLLAHVGVSL